MRLRWVTLVVWGIAAVAAASCEGKSAELCDGGEDEDQDGLIDCGDDDCWLAGGRCPEICSTIFDEDGDGYDACEDPDCWLPGGECPEDCDTDEDEDSDGLLACDDPDCWVASSRCEERCDGGNDEDGDGKIDCADSDCWLPEQGCPEVCEGGSDEDADTAIDCDDPDCWSTGSCVPSFALNTQPIFLQHCFGNGGACHSDASNVGGLSFESYDDMPLPSIYCAAGGLTKAECSLYRILEPSMPEDCLNCVPQEDVMIIQRWVEGGIPP